MIYEEEEEEEEEITEGFCDSCGDYCETRIACPEHFHEVKRNITADNMYCKACCRDSVNENCCLMSCGENFIEKYFAKKLGQKCEEYGLKKSTKADIYLNDDASFFIGFNKSIPSEFETDIYINQPFVIDEYCIVKHENNIHRYGQKYYNQLYDLLKYEFDEHISFSLVSGKTSNEEYMTLLKMNGDKISGVLCPQPFDSFETQEKFKSRYKNRFTEQIINGLDIFEIGHKIDKYCMLPQTYCHELISYQGKDSYFAAYPFSPDKYPLLVSNLKELLEEKDMKVILPIEKNAVFPDTGILFCKLCKMIMSTNSIICEITEINQNVMFEAGYAFGLGKNYYFLVDKSYDKNKRSSLKLINDLEKIYYIHEEDCAEAFSVKEEEISHYLPIRPVFGNKFDNDNEENEENKILLLLPDDPKYIRIEEEIKENVDGKYEFIDLPKTSGHNLINAYNNINKCEFVIGILLSDTYTQKELKNSKISFLLGLSLALGKKVLIFQEKPIEKKIIDFDNLSREFTNKNDLLKLITDYFK
ncbi:hypothetical protein [Methanolobus sp.]|uniref:hypothetical protein n=1 Tax=Methanolobus sp. TaxID=1874737 RepID=UPI0025F71CAF|nr:hypothetical protein [Methanolobus sp.]